MQGVYRASIGIGSVTTAKTLIYITVPATRVIEIYSARITSQNEDTADQIYAMLNRISSLGTPTASTITPKPLEEASSASACTVKGNVTGGEPVYDSNADSISHSGQNKLQGWEYVPLPEERCIIAPSDSVGLALVTDIAVATNIVAEIIYREMG